MIKPKKWRVLGGGVLAILAALAAVEGVRRHYIRNAKRNEALGVLSVLALAEEIYRAEHQEYFDVSGGSRSMHPRNKPTPDAVAWDRQTPIRSRFDELISSHRQGSQWALPNVVTHIQGQRVRFVYTVFAGQGAVPKDKLPKAIHHWLPFKNSPWYIALAAGDLDGDGELEYAAAASEYKGAWFLDD